MIGGRAISEQVSANRRRLLGLLGGSVVAVTLLGLVLGTVVGAPVVLGVVALLAGAAAVVWAYLAGDRMALAKSGAEPAPAEGFSRYHNVVEGLCVAAGLPKPELYVVRDPALNAFAVGRDPQHGAVAVTTGLLERLSRIELEGVVAQQLSHIRNQDTSLAALAVVIGTVAPPLVGLVVSGDRESLADETGVRLTRYPPGLIAALEKLRADRAEVASIRPATAHLWIEPPGVALDGRIAALKAM